jgi:Tfp pilus assembly protein PilZ
MPAAASKKTQCSSETVPVEVLLLSADVGTIEDLRHYMDQALMNVEVCSNAASVIHKLGRSRFDGFALDLRESKAGLELLLKVHNTRHCRRSVLLAILDKTTMQSEAGDVFRRGADFILERPFCSAVVAPTLRIAYLLMLREKRRYFRYSVRMPVEVRSPSGSGSARSINLSREGMAIITTSPVQKGQRLHLRMTLPDSNPALEIEGKVAWINRNGRAGIQFLSNPNACCEALDLWLAKRFEETVSRSTNRIEKTFLKSSIG